MPEQTTQQEVLAWSAPVIPRQVRTRRWYMVAAVVLIATITYTVYASSWPLLVVVLLIALMYGLMHGHEPVTKQCTIAAEEVSLNEKRWKWDEIEGWWMLPTPGYVELHIVHKAPRRADLVVQTGTVDIQKLRTTLQAHAKELTEKHERVIDMIIRICKL